MNQPEPHILLHDINNSLARMKSAAELSLLAEKLPAHEAENLSSIVAEIDRLAELLRQLRTHIPCA